MEQAVEQCDGPDVHKDYGSGLCSPFRTREEDGPGDPGLRDVDAGTPDFWRSGKPNRPCRPNTAGSCGIELTRRRLRRALIRSSASVITILSDLKPYAELGAVSLENRQKDHAIRQYVKQLE